MNRDIIVFDFETGGRDPNTCQVTQLAALALDGRNFNLKGTFNSEIWAEVDDPNDLRNTEFLFSKNNKLDLVADSFGGYWSYKLTDFCFIRNMYFPNSSIISEIKNNSTNLIYNYGSKQSYLNQKLSYFIMICLHFL